jgi:hypothetical protein
VPDFKVEMFEEIRSYRDDEVLETIGRLLKEEEAVQLLNFFFPEGDYMKLMPIESIFDFQNKVMFPIFEKHVKPTFTEMTCSGLENIDPKGSYVFISNHRDIVLDSALLNYFLHQSNIPTAEIAIGDNLLDRTWIKDLVRMNRSFIVKRGLDNVNMLSASRLLSRYIWDTVAERNQSVWIAQRAGRAKDGNDVTYRGLITMLYMSRTKGIIDHFKALNVVPVSVSYEFDPCDTRKTNELYHIQKGDYVKSENEDVESMQLGIVMPKGKGHLHFGKPINSHLDHLASLDRKAIITGICDEIDQQIQENYKLWPSNYAAHSLKTNDNSVKGFTEDDKKDFLDRMSETLKELNANGDAEVLKEIFLSMYEIPYLNQKKWSKSSSPIA